VNQLLNQFFALQKMFTNMGNKKSFNIPKGMDLIAVHVLKKEQ